ncbi:unnamed protein product, partial [Effrenium voratum]
MEAGAGFITPHSSQFWQSNAVTLKDVEVNGEVAIGALAACGDRRLADGTLAAAALQFYKANNAAPSPDVGNSHEDLELWAKKQGAGARRLASRLKNCMGHTPEKSKSSKLQEVKTAMLQRFEEKGMIEPLSANAPDLQASASKPDEDFDWDALADMLPKPVSEDLIPPGKVFEDLCKYFNLGDADLEAVAVEFASSLEDGDSCPASEAEALQAPAPESTSFDTPQKPSPVKLCDVRHQFVKEQRSNGISWKDANRLWMHSEKRAELLSN